MNRKPLHRRVGLGAKAPLRPKKPIRRDPAVPGKTTVNPIKLKRTKQEGNGMREAACRRIVRERSGGVCEFGCGRAAESMHHRKNRSQGGEWAPSNIVHLCGDGARGCHGMVTNTRELYYQLGWCVEEWRNPANTAVYLHRMFVMLDEEGGLTPALDLWGAA